jgi:dTDP-D-glucose 4,6-dehydratase
MSKKILTAVGIGFVGSSVIRYIINSTDCGAINIDKLICTE